LSFWLGVILLWEELLGVFLRITRELFGVLPIPELFPFFVLEVFLKSGLLVALFKPTRELMGVLSI
jgi:hypothetical protein